MGGNAIKSAKRINKTQFNQYWIELCELFPELRMRLTESYRKKEDFGDIDIIVETSPNINIKKMVLNKLGDIEHHDNGPYFSFLFHDAQIDFIFASEEEFEPMYNYMCWNDLFNFCGRVARTLGFKLGHDGLSFEKHLDDHYKISILISKDLSKILPFLGYDYEKWLNGFDTIEDILKYAASSIYFNSLYFSLEEQNNTDRVRNKKRKMYQNMLKYISDNNIFPKPKLTEDERKQHYTRAITIFGNEFDVKVKEKEAEYSKHLEFKKLFNGDVIKKLSGFEGKELGLLMQRIKNSMPNFEKLVIQNGEQFVKTMVNDVIRNLNGK